MEAWLDFGRGPLFRLCFVLMLLGLLRILALSIVGMIEAYRRSPDKQIPLGDLIRRTLSWLFPATHLWSKRPVYSTVSSLFHIGLILVPLFYAAHVLLWKHSVGFGWISMSDSWADSLTLITIAAGIVLFLMRALYEPARTLSRKQDYVWPLLLTAPFITGYITANSVTSATTYQWLMLLHVYSADLIMTLIPFTKIAHCLLMPLSQLVTTLSWKFPAGAGDRVIEALGYRECPTWMNKARSKKSLLQEREFERVGE